MVQKSADHHAPAHQDGRVPEMKGKTIQAIKLYLEDDDTRLSFVFSDRTHLNLDLERGLTVRTDLSD
jgi:hypothetical protein